MLLIRSSSFKKRIRNIITKLYHKMAINVSTPTQLKIDTHLYKGGRNDQSFFASLLTGHPKKLGLLGSIPDRDSQLPQPDIPLCKAPWGLTGLCVHTKEKITDPFVRVYHFQWRLWESIWMSGACFFLGCWKRCVN